MSQQDPDWIAFRGRNRMLLSYPLDAYLRDLPARPDFEYARAGHRGYLASWEVRQDHTLWLTGLMTRPAGPEPDPGLTLVFHEGGPVPATWVNQPLLTQDSQDRRYTAFGNGSTYVRETYLLVRDGRVVAAEEMDGTGRCRVGGELTPHLETIYGPEESAFLRACFAAPDDAAPRLVYADWLDERHDPRAEAVRLAEKFREVDDAGRQRFALPARIRARFGDWLWRRLLGYVHPVFDPNDIVCTLPPDGL
jgi:uncharacterized protein (TIGR02996 family)